MAEDWRVRVDLDADDHGIGLVDGLRASKLEGHVQDQLGERVVVSRDGPTVFLYADTQRAAREAERVVRSTLGTEGEAARIAVDRWHPDEESWEDAADRLPETPAEHEAEHEELMDQETRETRERGYAEFEVRVDLPTFHAASELSERLDQEGLPHVRRWKYILLGAENEDVANELADRLRGEAPSDAEVSVEGTFAAAAESASGSPFAFLGY